MQFPTHDDIKQQERSSWGFAVLTAALPAVPVVKQWVKDHIK